MYTGIFSILKTSKIKISIKNFFSMCLGTLKNAVLNNSQVEEEITMEITQYLEMHDKEYVKIHRILLK